MMTRFAPAVSSNRKSRAVYIALMSAWIVLMLLNHTY
ncbi:hypothetical protein TMRO357_00536 [Alteriqipengyuania sp. 357]